MKVAAAAVVVAYAGLVATVQPFTWPALVLTAIPALVIVVLAATRMARTSRPAPVRGVGLWLGLAAAVVVWELVAYFQAPRDDHPTLSSMLDALESNPPARAVLFVAWLALGVGARPPVTARTVTLLGWALLVLGAGTLGVVAFVRRGRFASPGNALDLVLWHPLGRALLLAGWVWLGFHLFAR